MNPLVRFARFNGVGALGIVVQLAAIALLTEVVELPYLAATVLGVSTAIVHNFAWHSRWTWADRAPGRRLIPTFFGFVTANGVVSLVGNVIVMVALVGGAGMPPLPANLIAIGTCGVVNFALADRVVFAELPRRYRPTGAE